MQRRVIAMVGGKKWGFAWYFSTVFRIAYFFSRGLVRLGGWRVRLEALSGSTSFVSDRDSETCFIFFSFLIIIASVGRAR